MVDLQLSSELTNLIVIGSIFLVSLISPKLSLPVVVMETLCGVVLSCFGVKPQDWMLFFASLGGVVITFLAGTEMNVRSFRKNAVPSLLIGLFSFFVPFACLACYTYYVAGWSLNASLIAGVALSTTSLGVVYSILMETGMNKTKLGTILMSATFVTDITTVLVLSVLFVKPTVYTLVFYVVSGIVIFAAYKYSKKLFQSSFYRNNLAETEVKYILFLLFIFIYFGELGHGHAVLPAFILGFLMADFFETNDSDCECETSANDRLRSSAYSFITPVFFIVGGLKLSVPLLISALGLFFILLLIQTSSKIAGVYFWAKKYLKKAPMYSTLLMTTGLTFGTIAAYFGLDSDMIDVRQYSVLIGVIVVSAVVPTIIAQVFFKPDMND